MTGDQNGWGEYSKLVLKELETLAQGMRLMQKDIMSFYSDLDRILTFKNHLF